MDNLDLIRELRSMGATRVGFYSEGQLESVDFVAPTPIALDEAPTDPAPAPGIPKAFAELMKPGGGDL